MNRCYARGSDLDLGWPVQQMHQHDEAILFITLKDRGNEAVESPAVHLHQLTYLVALRWANDGAIDFARLEAMYKFFVEHAQAIAAADESANPASCKDWPPALQVGIKAHEQIARK